MDEIVEYISKSKQQKIPEDQIRSQLKNTGWLESDIQKAFDMANTASFPSPPVPPSHKSRVLTSDYGIWITFAHVLLFISLYSLAISIGALLNQFVDIWIPTELTVRTVSTFYEFTMKISLAALIVSWPFFSLLFLYTTKKTTENPTVRNIRSRKLLIYTTLVITFVILLWSLTQTVYNFLNGSVTTNFLAHFAVTVGISGIIFTYLLNQVKHDRKQVNYA